LEFSSKKSLDLVDLFEKGEQGREKSLLFEPKIPGQEFLVLSLIYNSGILTA